MEKILLVIVMLCLLGSVRLLRQKWISPAGVNMVWNLFFVFFGVVIFGSGLEWNYGGIIWIMLSCFLFLLGQNTGSRIICHTGRKHNENKTVITNLSFVVIAVLIVFCLGHSLLYIKTYGFHPAELLNLRKLAQINNTIAVARYDGTSISLGGIGNIMLVFTYFVALIGGYLFLYAEKHWEKLCCFWAIVPALADMLVTNMKSELIAVIFLWISGYLTANICKNGDKSILSANMIGKVIMIGIICLVLFDFVMMLRIGDVSISTQKIVSKKMQTYAFGHIYAFSYWFHEPGKITYDLGTNTYMVFTNWLGITIRQQGVYDFISGVSTNVFTQNRGIITDFGKIGGLLYWYIYGNITGILWKNIKSTTQSSHLIAKTLLAAIYFTIFYGFIISPWVYSSYFLAFLIFMLALFVIKHFNVSMRGY